MMPSPYSDGPAPPEARPSPDAQVPPMPPSILSAQGQQAQGGQPGQPGGQGGNLGDSLKKETLQMAMQKLMEYKNSIESLLGAMKAVDPESVSLFIPALEVGKALESRLQQVMQRAANPSPSMAGMMGGAGPQSRGTSAAGV